MVADAAGDEAAMDAVLSDAAHHLHHVQTLKRVPLDHSPPLLPTPSYYRRTVKLKAMAHYSAHRGMSISAAALTHPAAWRVTVAPTHKIDRGKLARVLFLGMSFTVLFVAYNVAQTNLTSIFPDVGFYSFALTFSMFALGSIVAPAIGQVIGIMPAMAFGAATYTGLVAMFLTKSSTGILIMSPFTGFGGAMLWIHQGIWLTRITELSGANGFFTGLFFFIYNLNLLVGNGIVLILAAYDVSNTSLFYVLTAIASAGAVLIFFSPSPQPHKEISGPLVHVQHVSLHDWMKQLVVTAKQPWTQLLAFYMITQGITNTFSIGVLPSLMGKSITDNAYLFLAYGFSGCVASMISGRLFDKYGWQWLVGMQVAVTFGVHILVLVTYYAGLSKYWYVLCCGIASLADNCTNSINNMTISSMYAHDSSPAFSLYRFVFCATLAVTSIIASNVSFVVIVAMCLVSTIFAAAAYAFMRLHHMPPGYMPTRADARNMARNKTPGDTSKQHPPQPPQQQQAQTKISLV